MEPYLLSPGSTPGAAVDFGGLPAYEMDGLAYTGDTFIGKLWSLAGESALIQVGGHMLVVAVPGADTELDEDDAFEDLDVDAELRAHMAAHAAKPLDPNAGFPLLMCGRCAAIVTVNDLLYDRETEGDEDEGYDEQACVHCAELSDDEAARRAQESGL